MLLLPAYVIVIATPATWHSRLDWKNCRCSVGTAVRLPSLRTDGAPLPRADEVINSQNEDVVARVKEITDGKGAYSALDPVAGETTSQASLRRLDSQPICTSVAR